MTSDALPLFLTSEEPFYTCVVGEVSLTTRMRTMYYFISYLGRAQPPSSSCFYGVSAILEILFTEGGKCSAWGPCISYLSRVWIGSSSQRSKSQTLILDIITNANC